MEASHSASWNGSCQEIFDYLSDLRNLLPVIPNLQKLQIATKSNMARLLMTVGAMGQRFNIVIDLQARYLSEQQTIILSSVPLQTALFGPKPEGYMVADFRTEITLGKTVRPGNSLVNARLRLGLQELPQSWGLFLNSFLGRAAQKVAHEQIQKTVALLMSRLEQGFSKVQVA
jgi:hypothetical protein